MDDLLSYLDSVQIDVVKRKYYNANKVNAVFEEIRNQAEQLISENERLQTLLNEKEEEERSSAAAWSSVQETYREILIKAHDRAEAIISEAKERSAVIEKNAELRCVQTAKQVEDCFDALRQREEQNIEFLNTRMQAFLSRLNGAEERKPPEHKDSDLASYPGSNIGFPENAVSGKDDLPDDLVSKINQLSQEIQALETES